MAEMGRPKIEIDWEQLDTILKYKPSLVDAGELTKCHPDTLANKIREKHNMTFSEYREQKMAVVRRSLVAKALDMAVTGGNATMLIFCLKNLCGWTDVHQVSSPDGQSPITINIAERAKD